MAGNLIAKYDKVFKTLLILDSLRGEDSTGALFVSKFQGTTTVAKQLGDPFCLFNDKKFDTAFRTVNRLMLGHNRYATSGGVSRATAHPFEMDNIIGVHNGTLINKRNLLDSDDFRVDSENLYHHIDKLGLDDALQKMEGAWALVWWNKKEETLNFLRNKERPLYLCRAKDGAAIFWASEKWMLEIALSREGIKHGEVFALDVDLLHSIKIDNQGAMSKPTVRPAAAPEHVLSSNYFWPDCTVLSDNRPNQHTNLTVVKKTDTAKDSKNLPSTLMPDENYLQSKGVILETLGLKTDSRGGEYIICFDKNKEYVEIRLYLKKDDPLNELIGEDIKGDISSYVSCQGTPSRGYYKVSPWTVQLAFPTTKVEELYTTHNGAIVNEEVWKEKYKACAWCSSPLFPENENRFTTSGDCLCPGCSQESEVTQYVTLA